MPPRLTLVDTLLTLIDTPLAFVPDNPKKRGSASYTRYDAYKHSRSFAEFIANGGLPADIPNDYERNFVSIGTLTANFTSGATKTCETVDGGKTVAHPRRWPPPPDPRAAR